MVKAIDLQQLKKLKCKDMVLANALPAHLHKKKHIPGSISLPLDSLKELAPQVLPDKDQTIVVYCANKQCSASPQAAQNLEALGYTNVYDYEGGLEDWEENNGGDRMDGDGCGC